MYEYKNEYSTKEYVLGKTRNRKPDFQNIIDALRLKLPSRPTYMELFLNNKLYEDVLQEKQPEAFIDRNKFLVRAYGKLGYDYVTISPPPILSFPHLSQTQVKQTRSINYEPVIFDEQSYSAYTWPQTDTYDYSYLSDENLCLPNGMKAICIAPNGVLENTINLLGYDNLCIAIYENPVLLENTVNMVGQTLYNYYKNCVQYDTVGACFVNDDWGFNTQTMLSPMHMRKLIVPWHKRITAAIHSAGKYTIMHSCGMLWDVMDDIIYDIKSDGKHSYEDTITPVEQAYERLKNKIAVIGGIDIDFLCRKSPEKVYERAMHLLEITKNDGGYILGSGNSIPEYIPRESLFAMLSAALNFTYG